MTTGRIELRGVSVHNLKNVDLDIPHQQLVVICGVSGSGKTSLALDTLYAEGQRRYIESFSAYTRQYLERLEKPDADRIDGIPPAIAITHQNASRSNRSTVGTATEVADYLRLLMAKVGKVFCYRCGRPIQQDSPDSIHRFVSHLPPRRRFMITAAQVLEEDETLAARAQGLREDGFLRLLIGEQIVNVDDISEEPSESHQDRLEVIVDRLVTGDVAEGRLRESLETALAAGGGRCHLYLAGEAGDSAAEICEARDRTPTPVRIRDQDWLRLSFCDQLACVDCQLTFPPLEARRFSFNSSLGACPECEGFGNLIDLDIDLIVPNPGKTLAEGAIAPWNTPAYRHELEELLELSEEYDLPTDVPFSELTPRHVKLIREGVRERSFGGLEGFFAWLERRKYKMHIRVFLSRWRSYRVCDRCHGSRLREESLAVRLGNLNLAEISELKIGDAIEHLQELQLPTAEQQIASFLVEQVVSRLRYLEAVGLGYLTLDRTLRTLSRGELQRVALTSSLGSSLVNMLYVLDEPSIGLHPRDVDQLLSAIQRLQQRGNTVVLVEHDQQIIRAADYVVEIGPGAGEEGGRVTFAGTPEALCKDPRSLTGDYLTGRRGCVVPTRRREPNHGWIRLSGARGNNLQDVDVEFPLGLLCVVTGVSGAGKSTLVEQTLYPALRRRKRKDAPKPLDLDEIVGDGQIEGVLLIDQSPIGRSPRSNPVTYIKAFDAIRNVFADTLMARTRNLKASHFSFNVDGGRCDACRGEGFIQIDMQFLSDVMMRCNQCHGRRYRREILDVTYRGQSIADVLEMTVRQALHFFRGQEKVQTRLKKLVDVGLDYLRLGQPANTLSAGESQRLKLASYVSAARRGRTLFIMDEPTTGLHFSDVVQLLDCFEALIELGHSMLIVEHNLQMIQAADYVIDLGPGAADRGGQVVACGTPERIAEEPRSATGQVLAEIRRQRDDPPVA